MIILLTNDDGFGSAGINLLYEIATKLKFASEVWIVAPNIDMSGSSRSLSLRKPIQINNLEVKKYTISGTPTECVILALNKIMDKKPDLILSGINHGLNVGTDVGYSGTVAAAMEGAILSIPSIALSQMYKGKSSDINWNPAKTFAPDIIERLITTGWPKNVVMNINFPHIENVQGIKFVRQGQHEVSSNLDCIESIDDKGLCIIHENRPPIGSGSVEMVNNGFIAITPLKLDFTDYDSLIFIEDAFTSKTEQ